MNVFLPEWIEHVVGQSKVDPRGSLLKFLLVAPSQPMKEAVQEDLSSGKEFDELGPIDGILH